MLQNNQLEDLLVEMKRLQSVHKECSMILVNLDQVEEHESEEDLQLINKTKRQYKTFVEDYQGWKAFGEKVKSMLNQDVKQLQVYVTE